MDIKEWVERNREEKRDAFGLVGLHDDCQNYGTLNGKPYCKACTYYCDGHNHTKGRNPTLQCEMDMCYFYERKRKESEDGND